jgi:hypothetical protein
MSFASIEENSSLPAAVSRSFFTFFNSTWRDKPDG